MTSSPRLAVLIIAHANPRTFKRLVAALRHPRIAVFVHIDIRSDLTTFQGPDQDHVTFLAERQENHWGAFTQVEVALRLMETAQRAGPFASYVLISGDTMPLVTNEVLVDALTATPTAVRMRIQRPEDGSYRRVRDVYIPHSSVGRIRGLGSHLDRCLTASDLVEATRALRTAEVKRALPFQVYKGSQWLALSDAHLRAVQELVRTRPDIVEVFRYSLIPDELFFQTAIMILDPGYRSPGGIMEVDWKRKPKPFTLRDMSERELVFASRSLFFRKFCDQGLALIDSVLAERLDGAAVSRLGAGTAWRFLRGTPGAVSLATPADFEDQRDDA